MWHVKWVVRDQNNGDDKDEILVCVAADGRVTNWSIRKGFECAGKSLICCYSACIFLNHLCYLREQQGLVMGTCPATGRMHEIKLTA